MKTLLSLALFTLLCACSSVKPADFKNLKVRKIADGFRFTEGPAVAPNGDIYFSDIPNERIHKWSVSKNSLTTFMENSGGANGIYFNKNGDMFACQGLAKQVSLINHDKSVKVLASHFNGSRFNKPNDLWPDSKGGLYFSDPNYGRQAPTQAGEHVYYLSADGNISRVISDYKRPNGLIGTEDGKILYVTDRGDSKTYRYAINSDGSLSDKTLFCNVGSDGMTLDEYGNLYITSDSVEVYSPQGVKIASIQLPKGPSNVCFGGPEGKTLFITARDSFYSVKMPVKGMYCP